MPDTIPTPNLSLQINGNTLRVAKGTSVAAAMLLAAQPSRISVSGESRSALCGMGICFECRATVNGTHHQRTCQLLCEDGMNVETDR
jgi:sarcosine oxidase subunit alpha